jgi:hypothetical protein
LSTPIGRAGGAEAGSLGRGLGRWTSCLLFDVAQSRNSSTCIRPVSSRSRAAKTSDSSENLRARRWAQPTAAVRSAWWVCPVLQAEFSKNEAEQGRCPLTGSHSLPEIATATRSCVQMMARMIPRWHCSRAGRDLIRAPRTRQAGGWTWIGHTTLWHRVGSLQSGRSPIWLRWSYQAHPSPETQSRRPAEGRPAAFYASRQMCHRAILG